MRYLVLHKTTYVCDAEVSNSIHLSRLRPRAFEHQTCLNHTLTLTPKPALRTEREDAFGNPVCFFCFDKPYTKLEVLARSTLEVENPASVLPLASPAWEQVRELVRTAHPGSEAWQAREFVCASPLIPHLPELRAYALASFPTQRPLFEALLDLNTRIHRDFTFDPQATSVSTPVREVFRLRRGVCQDFAQLQIACLRSLGLAARYLSGYLETLAPPGKIKLLGADASHAWVSVYCPPFGWLELDPTNDQVAGERHLRLGWGRDFSDVSPLRGVFTSSGRQELFVSVDVSPLG